MNMNNTIKDIAAVQISIIDDFCAVGDSFNQFTYLLQLASELEELPEEKKVDDVLVEGCQSQVWLYISHKDDRIFLAADSDTLMVRGVLSILKKIFDGRTAVEILPLDVNFAEKTELGDIFDSKRQEGIKSIVNKIKFYASSLI